LAEAFQVGDLSRVDVAAVNGTEGLGSEAQIHGVAGFILEIDGKPREHGVYGLDSSEPPTAMQAITALGQDHQRLNMGPVDLARCGQFLEFFSHKFA
jgi:hypothetical protein